MQTRRNRKPAGSPIHALLKRFLSRHPHGKDILDYCKGRIASCKTPKVVKFVSEFPLTGSGKVKKQELREVMSISIIWAAKN